MGSSLLKVGRNGSIERYDAGGHCFPDDWRNKQKERQSIVEHMLLVSLVIYWHDGSADAFHVAYGSKNLLSFYIVWYVFQLKEW